MFVNTASSHFDFHDSLKLLQIDSKHIKLKTKKLTAYAFTLLE